MVSVDADDNGATGRVVIKKSDLSFTKPLRATTEMGTDDVNVKVPTTGATPLNGSSCRNFAVCWLAPSVKVPLPKFVPVMSVKKNEIVADTSLGFAMASPVFTGPFTSAKIRPSWIGAAAGIPASVTRTPF